MDKSVNKAKQNLKNICFFCGKNNPIKLPLPSDPVEVAKIELFTGRKIHKFEDGPQTMCSSCDALFNGFHQFYMKHRAVEKAVRNSLGLSPPSNNGGDNGTSEKETDDSSVDNTTLVEDTEAARQNNDD